MIKNFVFSALLLSSLSAFAAGDSLAIDEVKKKNRNIKRLSTWASGRTNTH